MSVPRDPGDTGIPDDLPAPVAPAREPTPPAVTIDPAMLEAARWIVTAGYPLDFLLTHAAPPAPLREAIVAVVLEDADGIFHGNELDEDEVRGWLADETHDPAWAGDHPHDPAPS